MPKKKPRLVSVPLDLELDLVPLGPENGPVFRSAPINYQPPLELPKEPPKKVEEELDLKDGNWIDLNTLQTAERVLIEMGFIKGSPLPKSQIKNLRGRIATAIEYEPRDFVLHPPFDNPIKWVRSPAQPNQFKLEELNSWRKNELKTKTALKDSPFCNPKIYKNIVDGKILLGVMEAPRLLNARERSNAYECIRGMFFMNRSAMKMAEFDHLLGLTGLQIEEEGLLYFADVCSGPGGFSEYIFWRKKAAAFGFGFTLAGGLDFHIGDFIDDAGDNFIAHYGPNSDGDVNNPDNVRSFLKLIEEKTEGKLVHFMLADGGFAVEGRETLQEMLSAQIYLSQCLIALGAVREGGSFLCKFFDIFSTFSVGLIFLMSCCFEEIAIHKPNTSRPANSERYLFCKKKRGDIDVIYKHLLRCHEVFWGLSSTPHSAQWTISELIPLEIIKDYQEFYNYILESNNLLGKQQLASLRNLIICYKDCDLSHKDQLKIKRLSLEKWDIPNWSEKNPPKEEEQVEVKDETLEKNVTVPE